MPKVLLINELMNCEINFFGCYFYWAFSILEVVLKVLNGEVLWVSGKFKIRLTNSSLEHI